MTALLARARERLARRMAWCHEPCQCGDERRVHVSASQECVSCPCAQFVSSPGGSR